MLNGQLHKQLGQFKLDVSLTIGREELLVILGASGCGKSTLLNCIAGFTPLDGGVLELDKCVYDDVAAHKHTPIHERQIAYIQQGRTLFPHLSVKENILYSIPKKQWVSIYEKYQALLALLNMETLEHRKPESLSGGQQQRVAIARVLMMNPKLILWDEPFSALDHIIREDLRRLVLSLKERLNIPMIFVTHDLEEAFQLADRLAIMSEGQILQMGDRDQVFNSPVNETVGKILGITNCLRVTYAQEDPPRNTQEKNVVTFKCDDIHLKGVDVDARLAHVPVGARVNIGIRPEQILYVREEAERVKPLTATVQGNIFTATVLSIVKHLENYRLKIMIVGLRTPMMMDIPRGVIQRYDIHEGQRIKVLLKYKRILIMDVDPDASMMDPAKELVDNTAQRIMETATMKSCERYKTMAKGGEYACPVIGIAGVSNSGKTTVVTELIRQLASKGHNVGTIKHDGHGFEMDHPGKDTYLHRVAGAKGVAIASRGQYSIIRQTPEKEIELQTLINQYADMDVILVEGYKFSDVPKFEVIRKERSSEGVCRKETLLGVITDVRWLDENIPAYDLLQLSEVVETIETIMREVSHEG